MNIKMSFFDVVYEVKKICKTILQEQVFRKIKVLGKFFCNLMSKLARSTLNFPGTTRVKGTFSPIGKGSLVIKLKEHFPTKFCRQVFL
jgi:hypothetical protein